MKRYCALPSKRHWTLEAATVATEVNTYSTGLTPEGY